jgi:hypothetical protein
MNSKAEKLSKLIGMPVDVVKRDIDKGMWDILIELNSKNYFTLACCEGHLKENGDWNGYITFVRPYKFSTLPIDYQSVRQRRSFYWEDNGEESREKFIKDLYEWALSLPVRELEEIKIYTLFGKSKRRANGKWKKLRSSYDYYDIELELNRSQTKKYELKFEEKVIGVK